MRQTLVRDLGLMLMENSTTSDGGKVVARNSQDTRVIVEISAAGIESTKGTIRIQPGWNEGLSIRIHQMIKDKLK